ncbi:MAG: class I SAM-dependent methyltransferase [Phycisphaeraceae bacterium]|nr:class I SAM-dependent methyltransferase [Phycisphaeraceae bacterium]
MARVSRKTPEPVEAVKADFYADPLVYDVLHKPGTRGDVAALRRMARRFLGAGEARRWLEPGCGSGRYCIALAAKGERCWGFDRLSEMVEFASNAARDAGVARRATFFTADMRTFDRDWAHGPAVDVAFNLINTLRHLSSDAAVKDHLCAVSRVLRPGGVYIVGLSLSDYGHEAPTEDVWQGRGRGLSVTQVVQYLPAPGGKGRGRAEQVISHMVVKCKSEAWHVDSVYSLHAFDLAQWTRLVGQTPLRIEAVTDGEGRPATPAGAGYYVFVLRKSLGATARAPSG